MLKADVERMTHYYYRKSKVKTRTFEEFQIIEQENNIRDIFEVYEDGFIGKWYYVIKKKGSSFAMDYGLNNTSLSTKMEPYMEQYNGKKINVEELKLYQKGIFPAIHKVDEDFFLEHCNTKNKMNDNGYSYVYTETSDGFLVCGNYNNIFYSELFDLEEDAISSLLNLNIISKDIPRELVYRYVIDDRKEKDFEMIF